ncbi:MAG: glycosyltransferase [Capsulimonadales bacterium]|nr:glycosyltransferase [Capsulimonadales bacterium]
MVISVCIPSVRPITLAATIDSIRRQSYENWELLVVGQGEDPEIGRLVRGIGETDPRIRYLHLAERGISRARNAGIAQAQGEVIAFIDDDCEADPDWLRVISDCFSSDDGLGLVGGSVIAPEKPRGRLSVCPEKRVREALYDPVATPGRPPAGWDWIGANFAVRRAVFSTVGGFDECLGAGERFAAGEDTDFKLRLERHGVRMLSTPRALVHHTYGRRFGLKAIFRHVTGYALGNGATAAKLTLLGLPEGEGWARRERNRCLSVRSPRGLVRLPWSMVRLYLFQRAYRECLSGFHPVEGNLKPREFAGKDGSTTGERPTKRAGRYFSFRL